MEHPALLQRRAGTTGRPSYLTSLVLGLLACLLLAGCAADADPAPTGATAGGQSAADPGFPVEVVSGYPDTGTSITVASRPTSIVSLSPTATEMLWAIGAGDQVVAVDNQSDYPEGVPTTELSGYEPNVEAILSYEPDLVISAGDSGDMVAGLAAAGVPTLLLPAATALAESYAQMERLGAATGHVAEAAKLVGQIRTDIEAAVADAPDLAGTTYFHELTPDLYTATGGTFIGEVYGLFGLQNIADAADSGDEYPRLSAEYVVGADPDLVFLADTDCCGVTVAKVRNRPGWSEVSAVQRGQVHVVDKDIASRWGPRVVDFVEMVSAMLTEYTRATEPATTG